jgi:Tol biopolymer transport system component
LTEQAIPSADRGLSASEGERLESWKEIAAYLKRDVRTVQRWERRGGLPVHRREENLGGVYAYRGELDVWRRNGHSRLEEDQAKKANGTRENRLPRRLERSAFIGPVLLAALVLLGALGFYSYRQYRQTGRLAQNPVIVRSFSLPGWSLAPTFSPNGKEVAFAWDGGRGDGSSNDIYVIHIGSSEPRRLTFHPSRFVWPRWSPDGRSIAFTRQSEPESGIFLIPSAGGPERKLLALDWPTLPGALAVSWTPDGKDLAFVETSSPPGSNRIALLSLDTLEHHALTQPPTGESDEGPEVSPDGRNLAFLRQESTDYGGVYVMPISGGEPTVLAKPEGPARGIAWFPGAQAMIMAGRLRGVEGLWKIAVDGQSKLLYPTLKMKPAFPAFSAQGDRLAISLTSYEEGIWQVDLTKKQPPTSLISSLDAAAEFPQYSPDGERIVFQSDRSGNWEIWVCDRDGLNPLQLTFFAGPPAGYPRWSPDGRQVVFDVRGERGSEIYVVSRDGGSPRRLITGSAKDEVPGWSRDGRWVYFASKRGGVWQIWKVPAAGGQSAQVTNGGGYAPVESSDGKVLYYAKGPDSPGIWRVDQRGNEEPMINILPQGHWADWAVRPNGIYFIDPLAEPRPAIQFFSYAARRITLLSRLETYPQQGAQGLAVSPDCRWLLYPKLKVQGDIVFVQNLQ